MTTATLAPYETRSVCRVCDGALADVMDFGHHPLPDFTRRDAEASRAVAQAPLTLARCEVCGLAQLRHTVARSALFGPTYPYRSGVNDTMKAHLRDIVTAIPAFTTLRRGDFVVDIGANDGTLMGMWPKGIHAFGFEPSLNLARLCWDREMAVVSDFFDARTYEYWAWFKAKDGDTRRAKAVTSIAMFYDVDDPVRFCKDVAQVLHPEGVWVNEFNYFPAMCDRVAFDMVGHEHLTYYRLADIIAVYHRARLEVIHAEVNSMNGGSLRVVAAHRGAKPVDETVADVLRFERDGLTGFIGRVEAARTEMMHTLHAYQKQGKRVYLYGASTRGVTILHHFGIDETLVVAAADRNPDKWGCYVPGTGIPIVSEDEFRANADVGLVLPYTFIREFKEREQEWLKRGGVFLVPLPQLAEVR